MATVKLFAALLLLVSEGSASSCSSSCCSCITEGGGSACASKCTSCGSCSCAGKANYCSCPTIGSDPELVSSDTDTGFGTAACVWGIMSGHSLSNDADGSLAGFKATACYINAGHSPCGDPNGWASRESYWYQANSCLGISEELWMEDFLKFNASQAANNNATTHMLRGNK